MNPVLQFIFISSFIWVFNLISSSPVLSHARDPPQLSPFPASLPPTPAVAITLVVLATFYACFLWGKAVLKAGPRNVQISDTTTGLISGPVLNRFNPLSIIESIHEVEYTLIEAATNNFSESNILGKLGYEPLYKAHFNFGSLAVVKKLDSKEPRCERAFENEIVLLSNIKHPNIVSLLGYCVYGEARLLVYELMQNGSLEAQLHGPSSGSRLTWHIRMKIALDAARGLEYLHEHCNPPVVHGALKSSNILLDSNFNAKLSDFSHAISRGNHNEHRIKLSDTRGHVAPEYFLDGELTEKSDVYAFGMVLLELLMGWKSVERMTGSRSQSGITWAMPQLIDREKLPDIVDPVIRHTMDQKHLCQVAAVAVLCVQQEPSYRPSIADVVYSLIPLVPNTARRDSSSVSGPKS